MLGDQVTRKLAVILAADMAGYTLLTLDPQTDAVSNPNRGNTMKKLCLESRITTGNLVILTAVASLLAMTVEGAAKYDKAKYDACYALQCKGLEDTAANAAGAGSRESSAHGIAIIACDLGCKKEAQITPICGAKNQRPCKITERVPSCDKGLKENFIKGKCVSR